MRLLLAVQQGNRAAVERAVDTETGSLTAGAPVAAAPAADTAKESQSNGLLAPGCRAVVVSLPKQSARHNGERCLVVRHEGDLYGVCCDSGAALRLKSDNLKITPGAQAMTRKDALWFACTMLPPDTINTTKAHQRRMIVRLLMQTAQLATAASNRVVCHRVDSPIGPMQTTPLLECCCAGAFSVAKELVSAFGRNANAQCSIPVGAGPAAGATPLLVACSYRPSVAHCGDDGPNSDDDDDEEHEVSQRRASVALEEAPLAGLTSLVETLLEARADINAADHYGRTPALACIVNGQVEVLKVLLASDPAPRLDARCGKSGLSPLAAACMMGSSETNHLVETAANAQGLMHLAAEERRAANTCVLMDKIVSKVEAEAERLDLPEHDEDSERTTAAILLMELGIVDGDAPVIGQTATSACVLRLERMLERLEEDATSSDFSNPLEMAVRRLMDYVPAVHRKAWLSEHLVNSNDRAVLLSLQAAASAEDTRPLLAQMPEPFLARAAGSERWLVSPECHRFK